ncbi:MAG: ATP-binding cassette domain-containing protein [Desulfovibrio sp.]|nr:ATP-binding cassette domain-containing protein [Desulfovibrio sp.]
MSEIYRAQNLVQVYGTVTALSLASFSVKKGEVVALTGPNGSGKSTLLRLLAFLEKPSAGELLFFGQGDDPRREVTLLLQEPYLLKDTVFRNVTLGLALRGKTSNLKAAFETVMHAVGFEDAETMGKRFFHALSGGEKQRVALASRLIVQPTVLLLDEPTSSVDARSARAIECAVRGCIDSGTTVIYATHDLSLLKALGGREVRLGEV